MSKKSRKRYTKRERRNFSLRPHPPEVAIPKSDLTTAVWPKPPIESNVEDISEEPWTLDSMDGWSPMMGETPFPDFRKGVRNMYDVHDRKNTLL